MGTSDRYRRTSPLGGALPPHNCDKPVRIFILSGAPFFLYFIALYASSDKNSSAGSFERVSNLNENFRRAQTAWQRTMLVSISPI
jgi:hypothetical protein